MHDIVIIGSGPSGLTASIYAVRAGNTTLCIAGTRWGGQLMLTTEVENFPGFPDGIQGPDLMMNMRKQAERLGVQFINTDASAIDVSSPPFRTTVDGKPYESKSLIIATGADSIWLDIPGEMQLRGKGISTCATCDAFFFRKKSVVIVGGGDTAMEEAMVLSNVASSVTIIHRRDSFRASDAMQKKVLATSNISVLWNKTITQYVGTDHLTGIMIKDTVTQKEELHKTDGVFLAIGHKPNTSILSGIDLDEKGYVKRKTIHDKDFPFSFSSATNVQGVFVCGDVHDTCYRQAITAAGFGCMAALDADRWLKEHQG